MCAQVPDDVTSNKSEQTEAEEILEFATMVATEFGLGAVSDAGAMASGFNQVFRVKTSAGAWIVRLSPPGWVDPSYEHALRDHLAERTELVTKPVRSAAGESWTEYTGGWVSVYPFVDGETFGFYEWSTTDQADVLAEMHRHTLEFPDRRPRDGYPPLRAQAWDRRSHTNAEERLADIIRGDGAHPLAGMADEMLAAFTFVRRWVAAAADGAFGDLTFAPIHGDYGPHNLVARNGSIVSVIDWDDCRGEWLAWEVARAAWQFHRAGAELVPVAESAFVRTYLDAGGPLTAGDLATLDPLLTCVLVQIRLKGIVLSRDMHSDDAVEARRVLDLIARLGGPR